MPAGRLGARKCELILSRTLRLAAQTGFQAEPLEKTLHLLELLEAMRSHPFLSGRLALKGGTAINLFAAEESDLSISPAGDADGDPGLERAGFLFGRDLWPLLLLVAVGLWVLEWALFHRRITQ